MGTISDRYDRVYTFFMILLALLGGWGLYDTITGHYWQL